MKIAVLANLKDNAPLQMTSAGDHLDELDSDKTINAIIEALEKGGHHAVFMEASLLPQHDLMGNLQRYQPDICFNIAEGHWGDGREAQIPAVLEQLNIPYTGSKVLTLALALDKPMTKRLLHYHNLPTAEFQVFGHAEDVIDDDLLNEAGELKYQMFIKPSREGTGIGVTTKSIVNTIAELKEQVAWQLKLYHQPILAERFIKGREITVGVLGNLKPTSAARRINERTAPNVLPEELTLLPAFEVNTEAYPTEGGVYTNRVKVELVHDFFYTVPANISPELTERLQMLTAATFRVLGCLDVARVDFRIDETDGTPYILEVNPLPGLNPEYSDLVLEAYALKWTYDKLINTIVDIAVERQREMIPAV